MNRFLFALALLLALFPSGRVYGGGHKDHFGKVTVSSTPDGGGTVYIATTENATTGNKSVTWQCSKKADNDTKEYYLFAEAGDAYVFTGWSGSGTSSDNPYRITVTAAGTSSDTPTSFNYTANFSAIKPFTVLFRRSPEGGRYTVDDQAVTGEDDYSLGERSTKYKPVLRAIANEGFSFLGWYTEDASGNKKYFSTSTIIDDKVFTSSALIGVDFIPSGCLILVMTDNGYQTYDDLSAALAYAVNTGGAVSVYDDVVLSSDATIGPHVKVNIADGKKISVASGATLYVDGEVSGGTVVSTGGTVSKCVKLIAQSTDVKVVKKPSVKNEVVTYEDAVKYRATSSSSPSLSIPGTPETSSHLTAWNGAEGVYHFQYANSPKVVKCRVETKKAKNHIIGIEGTDSGISADSGSGFMYVLLEDVEIDSSMIDNSKKLKLNATIDCAGRTLSTPSVMTGPNFSVWILNGSYSLTGISNLFGQENGGSQNSTVHLVNCPNISLKSWKINYDSGGYNFYDCGPSLTITYTNDDKVSEELAFFYGGRFDNISIGGKSGYDVRCSVYSGSYKVDPKDYLFDKNYFRTEPENGYYVVREANSFEWVAEITKSGVSTRYPTLAAAVDAAGPGDTISLIARNELGNETLQINKDLTILLNGYAVNGGTIQTSGNVLLTDATIRNDGSISSRIENSGTLEIAFGTYPGTILNEGSLTVYNGNFTGTLNNSGSGVLDLRGGSFSQSDISAFVTAEGYKVVPKSGRYYVCRMPNSTLEMTTGSVTKLTATPYTDDGYELMVACVKNGKMEIDEYSSLPEWKELAELYTLYGVYSHQPFDATVIFDRTVSKDDLVISAGAGVMSKPVDFNGADADVPNRYLTEMILSTGGKYAKTFGAVFTEGYSSVSVSLQNKNAPKNDGTTVTVMCELWQDVGGKTNTVMVLASRRFVFGAGSNKAMIRPETGAVTFYQTLADAVNAVSAGGTVMLCNDGATGTAIGKECTIDLNGFTLGSALSAAAGYQMDVSSDGRYYTFTTAAVVEPTITASVATEVPSGGGVAVTGSVPTGLGGATYTLLKQNAAGAFEVVEGTGKTSPDFTLAETGLYQIRVTANEKTADSETIGVLKYAAPASATEQTTIVAVPWEMTLDVLLRKGDFAAAEGNKWNTAVKVYNAVNEKYEMWTLTGTLTGTEWTPCRVVSKEDDGKSIMTTTEAATARTLARGSAVWVTRKNASSPFYICGICPKEASASTTLASGWNLVANPLFTTFDLNSITGGANDRIIVPSATGLGQKTYTYENGAWGYMGQQEVIRNGTVVGVRNTRITTGTEMAPGQGFWYVKDGTGSPAAINWPSTGTDN